MTDRYDAVDPVPPRSIGQWRRAQGMTDGLTQALARQERELMRAQALDDQMFAAILESFGGDERTARIFWDASRTVLAHATSKGSWRIRDPKVMVARLRAQHPDW